jgi:hypothetical protein
MRNTVVDASVVAVSNGDLRGRRQNNSMDRRLLIFEEFASRSRRPLYNSRLFSEYQAVTRTVRNDAIRLFLELLTERGLLVRTNRLQRGVRDRAWRCRWPKHDQHLMAAALGATDAELIVTENTLAACQACVLREFGVRVVQV